MRFIRLFIFMITLPTLTVFGQVLLPGNKPNRTQQMQISRGYGMFMHFGINTFTGDEWSDGSTPAQKYNPTSLDCDQWVRVARDAGFRYVLLTVKHHDGFCLWDSKFTDYDVASSPVKADVVAAVSRACKKYGIEFAIYYSLWDRHEPSYKDPDPSKYVDFMMNQLTELLTGYGPVCELWFDGGWDRKPEDWEIGRVYQLVKKLQPHCAIGINHTIVHKEGERDFVLPDLMTEDNKYFFQYFPSDFRLWDPKIANKTDKKQYLHQGQSYYLPFEHTICLSKEWTWFQKLNPRPSRDLDELEELFYRTTENDNVLVINVPPDHTGRITEQDANTVIALGRRLNIKRGKPLPKNGRFISLGCKSKAGSVYANDIAQYGPQLAIDGGMQTRWAAADTLTELIVNLKESDCFNKISIFEYQDERKSNDPNDIFSTYRFNRIQSYTIDIWKDDNWRIIFTDNRPMGDCKVIRFPVYYRTSKIRLKVLKATAPPSIYEFNVIDSKVTN
ncbi:MAG: alpha-L-fucosidase [Bacteroidota bacterium]|nr:alpha-L-fucosidase [Bacteroidota bacterium]